MVIADISGYARFVADTEIEHSREILSELLETVVQAVGGHLQVTQLEGDAIFFIGAVSPAAIVGVLEQTFIRFHQRIRAMRAATTCPCNACQSIGNLNLKFVVHSGTYSFQRVGAVQQVYGTEVNLAHRLLKNHIPSHEYLLASAAFLGDLPEEVRTGFRATREEYDIGVVECGYLDLGPAWLRAQAAERRTVSEDESLHTVQVDIAAPIARVWQALVDPGLRVAWMGAPRMEIETGARGTFVDTQFHCHHGANQQVIYRVVSAREPFELNEECSGDMGTLFETRVLEPLEPGLTRFTNRMSWDQAFFAALPPEQLAGMQHMLQVMDSCYVDRLPRVVFGEKLEPFQHMAEVRPASPPPGGREPVSPPG